MNALLFGVYGFFMDIQMDNPGADPTLMQIYLAGTGSGIVNRYLHSIDIVQKGDRNPPPLLVTTLKF